ncbi:DUF6545 domain-containing protein [Streptomyces sp. NPDC058623]|uniref:DUF6545 domain-containing protein n=1 Tax=Streptomyces sp. NPDC058623 TaxID=3346563 RepID=UPI003665B8F0
METGVNYYVPAAVVFLVLIAKLPALLRGWRLPMVRTVNIALALGCAVFTFSAPPTIMLVNRLTGVSNFSAPLVYVMLSAFSCSFLVLIENWRADSRHQAVARRRVRRWKLAYTLVGLIIIACFVLGEAPEERLRDFDTYYSATPFIREMIFTYLLAHCVAVGAATVVTWKWSLDIRKDARKQSATAQVRCLWAGLLTLAVGFLLELIFGIVKLTGALTRSPLLNEGVAPLISLAAFVVSAGFLIPVFGQRAIERVWQPWRAYRTLNPLHRVVRPPNPDPAHPALLVLPWHAGPEQRLVHRETSIQDWILGLRPYFDDDVRERAHLRAVEDGASGANAVAAGLAAMVRSAADSRGRGEKAENEENGRAVSAYREAETQYRDLPERLSRAL